MAIRKVTMDYQALRAAWYYSTDNSTDTLVKVWQDCTMGGGTLSVKAAGKAHGVSYQPSWAWCYYLDAVATGKAVTVDTDAKLATYVTKARDKDQLSWGHVMSRANVTEGRARRAYERKTNVQSAGTRTGAGGRYLHDDGTLYDGTTKDGTNRAKVGPRLPVTDGK